MYFFHRLTSILLSSLVVKNLLCPWMQMEKLFGLNILKSNRLTWKQWEMLKSKMERGCHWLWRIWAAVKYILRQSSTTLMDGNAFLYHFSWTGWVFLLTGSKEIQGTRAALWRQGGAWFRKEMEFHNILGIYKAHILCFSDYPGHGNLYLYRSFAFLLLHVDLNTDIWQVPLSPAPGLWWCVVMVNTSSTQPWLWGTRALGLHRSLCGRMTLQSKSCKFFPMYYMCCCYFSLVFRPFSDQNMHVNWTLNSCPAWKVRIFSILLVLEDNSSTVIL